MLIRSAWRGAHTVVLTSTAHYASPTDLLQWPDQHHRPPSRSPSPRALQSTTTAQGETTSRSGRSPTRPADRRAHHRSRTRSGTRGRGTAANRCLARRCVVRNGGRWCYSRVGRRCHRASLSSRATGCTTPAGGGGDLSRIAGCLVGASGRLGLDLVARLCWVHHHYAGIATRTDRPTRSRTYVLADVHPASESPSRPRSEIPPAGQAGTVSGCRCRVYVPGAPRDVSGCGRRVKSPSFAWPRAGRGPEWLVK
jgi:hypothetical protein